MRAFALLVLASAMGLSGCLDAVGEALSLKLELAFRNHTDVPATVEVALKRGDEIAWEREQVVGPQGEAATSLTLQKAAYALVLRANNMTAQRGPFPADAARVLGTVDVRADALDVKIDSA